MATDARQLYVNTVSQLSPEERLQLAAMILEDLETLAPRIVKNCLPRLRDRYFKDAVREAMVQVEMALIEKGKVEGRQFGANLIGNLFAGEKGAGLRVPLGEEQQADAEKYFKGVFAYYRNYSAHDGSNIDNRIALRVLIIASELLELIDASELTLTDLGGVEGLIRIGGFGSSDHLGALLALLDEYVMPAGNYEGLYEDLAKNGFEETELEKIIGLNLVEMHSGEFETLTRHLIDRTEVMEWFELTQLGRKTSESIAAEI